MGIPGVAWFCENGHLVQQTYHHEYCDDPKKCSWCGSPNLRMTLEWGDEEYQPEKGWVPPLKPIDIEIRYVRYKDVFKKVKNKFVKVKGEFYREITEDVYDVSKLFDPTRGGK